MLHLDRHTYNRQIMIGFKCTVNHVGNIRWAYLYNIENILSVFFYFLMTYEFLQAEFKQKIWDSE